MEINVGIGIGWGGLSVKSRAETHSPLWSINSCTKNELWKLGKYARLIDLVKNGSVIVISLWIMLLWCLTVFFLDLWIFNYSLNLVSASHFNKIGRFVTFFHEFNNTLLIHSADIHYLYSIIFVALYQYAYMYNSLLICEWNTDLQDC